MKYLLQIVNPLYFLLNVCSLAFTIVFSPAIFNKTSIWLEWMLNLINNILYLLLLAMVVTSLLLMARKDWRTGVVGGKLYMYSSDSLNVLM